jgi:putative endonuclease
MHKSTTLNSPLSSAEAEALVATIMEKQGWRILARNYRQHGFELDIVASKETTLVFLEVKARKWMPRYSSDLECLLPFTKRQALRRGGEYYCVRFGLSLSKIKTMRFDLAIVCRAQDSQNTPRIRYFVDVLG